MNVPQMDVAGPPAWTEYHRRETASLIGRDV
ncbi:uncharacterized protein METZ01_LOCUS59988 [marine metagenome]|uniref:Uncharacterized protein n=1 Tax=marine metagenome TaxID=408172 RepID=A0A381SUQ5_9ZZZZ